MILEMLKRAVAENKVKSATSFIIAVVGLVGAVWAVDDHYAKAADVDTAVNSLNIGQKSIAVDMQIQLNKQSIREYRSKINDIEDKEAVTRKVDPVDANKKKRLQQEVDDLKADTDRLEKQKFQLERQQMQLQKK